MLAQHLIEADCLLTLMLRRERQVSIRQLNEARSAIGCGCPSVYIELTKDCLIGVVNRWHQVLVWEGDFNKRLGEWPEGYVKEVISSVPSEVRHEVLRSLPGRLLPPRS